MPESVVPYLPTFGGIRCVERLRDDSCGSWDWFPALLYSEVVQFIKMVTDLCAINDRFTILGVHC